MTCAGRGTIEEFTIDAVTGKLTAITPALSLGTGTGPRGIAVDASGSFVYTAFNTQNRAGAADGGNQRDADADLRLDSDGKRTAGGRGFRTAMTMARMGETAAVGAAPGVVTTVVSAE